MIARHPWGGLADPAATGAYDVAILGVPFDGNVCFRAGSAEAPARLRAVSSTSPAISEVGEIVEPASLRVRDLGDVAVDGAASAGYFARLEKAASAALRGTGPAAPEAFLLAIGGDHSVNIPLVRAFAAANPRGFGLVSLDAHPDLFDTYDGSPTSHACPMRRALDTGRLRPEHLIVLGTRSYNAVEIAFMRERGILFVPARRIDAEGAAAAVALARERLRGVESVYLSIDIDVADPSCAPGTGAPVAGGLSSRQILDLTRGLVRDLPVRAMDLVEIAPPLDPAGITLFLALQIVFETFAVLAAKRGATSS